MHNVSRRAFLSGTAALAALSLAGCNTTARNGTVAPTARVVAPATPVVATASPAVMPVEEALGPGSNYGSVYAAIDSEPFPIQAIDTRKIKPEFLRQDVMFNTTEAPGTIVVDPQNRFLYLVEGGGRARRYGVGVGKQGFSWSGDAVVKWKQAWPDWYPPKEMIERRPDIQEQLSQLQSGLGVKGGSGNPLGARAMYLFQNDKDTLYRIHGTTEPYSIGKNVSSGCIRMINQDAIDLFNRVQDGAKVVVIGNDVPYASGPSPASTPSRSSSTKKKKSKNVVAQG
jgi:lipoprotein-anchoring transpeptidase ErfK/SrfK